MYNTKKEYKDYSCINISSVGSFCYCKNYDKSKPNANTKKYVE